MGLAQRFTPLAVSDAEVLFRDKLAATFGAMEWQPVADGSIHRFHVPGDKAGTHNGWYVLFHVRHLQVPRMKSAPLTSPETATEPFTFGW